MTTYTPEQLARKLRTWWPKESAKVAVKGLRRGMYYGQIRAFRILQTRSIGRAILGKYAVGAAEARAAGVQRMRTSDIRLFIKRLRVIVDRDVFRTGLEARGFAALIETGGRTKRHEIKAKLARVLANQALGEVYGAQVTHFGSNVPRQPFLGEAVTDAEPVIRREMNAGYEELARSLG